MRSFNINTLTMKSTLLFIALLVTLWNQQGLTQANKQTVQVYQFPSHITHLHLNLPSNNVTIVKTKSSRISVETTINLDRGSELLLEYLISKDRYKLQGASDANSPLLKLHLQPNSNVLIIKGQVCHEHLSYRVHVPERLLKVTKSQSAFAVEVSE